jgi:hypothetical protein
VLALSSRLPSRRRCRRRPRIAATAAAIQSILFSDIAVRSFASAVAPGEEPPNQRRKKKKETSWSIEHMIYKSNLSVPFRFRFLFYTRNYFFHFFILFFLFEMWPGQMVVWRESGFITTIRIEKHGGLVNYLSLSLTHTILWFVVIYLPCTVRKCTHLLLNRCHLAASSSMIFLNGSRRFYFPNECRWYRLVLLCYSGLPLNATNQSIQIIHRER